MIKMFNVPCRPALAFVALASISLSACVSNEDFVSSQNSREQARFDDNCVHLRKPFEDIRKERDKVFAGNIMGGIVVGALLAGALGGDRDDALAGAILGGLAGAARGYAQNAASRGATEASLARFVDRDARAEAAQNDRLVATLLKLNACRLDQVEAIAARSRNDEITVAEARNLLRQVRRATQRDNQVVKSVAGNNRSYDAYVGVLDAKDIAAARRTKSSVASYQPSVRKVTRTARGAAAINPGPGATGATGAALARNSNARLDAVGDASTDVVLESIADVEGLIGNKDVEVDT